MVFFCLLLLLLISKLLKNPLNSYSLLFLFLSAFRLTSRQHSVECQGVVIAFYIAPDHMLRICADYPELEEELWKRAAVTAAKLRLVEPPHDYRHRLTRDLRIAFQNGRVSSPITRKSKKYSEKWGLEVSRSRICAVVFSFLFFV